MSNIQKAFKAKAKRGLCMAVGGVADPSDLLQNPTAAAPTWSGGFKSMDFDPQANLNSLSPTPPASAANPMYGGRFGNDPHFSASTSRVLQNANLGRQAPAPAQRSTPAPSLMTPIDDLIPGRRGLQMADGGVVETPEQVMARMAAKYGLSSAPQEPSPVPPAPAPASVPAQPSGGLFQQAVRTLRGRAAQIDKATNYAEGGVAQVKGPGTGTSDDIPLTLRTGGKGVDINVSNGEGLAVLPAKTMQHPEAIDAVNTIIETTNGKPTATRGLRAGGRYAEGTPGWWDKTKSAFDAAKNAFTPAGAPQAASPSPVAPVAEAAGPVKPGTPFRVDGPLSAEGLAADKATAASTQAKINTNLRPNTTVVGQLTEGVKDVGQSIAKVGPKLAAIANNPYVRNAGNTAVALSAVEPVVETFQNKNQIRLEHPELGQLGALASRTNEVLANTVDLGLKGIDNLSDMTRVPMNWAVEQLGGPKNYFRGRALSNALHSVYGAEPTAGTGPRTAEASVPAKPAVLPTTPLGDGPMMFAPAATPVAAPAATAPAEPNAKPANDIQVRSIRTPDGRTQKEFFGKDVKQTYTGADGKPTKNWEDTKDFKDAQARAGKDKELLKTYEKWGIEGDLKSPNEFYQRRGLARQKAFDENTRTDVAREVAAANRDIQRQDLDIRREDLGLRRAQEARALAGAQFDRENKILETQRKATEDMDKDEEQAFKAYSPMFTRRGKDSQGNEVDLEDKDAHSAFINAVRHTMAQRGVVNPVNGKPLGFGSLNKAEQDRLFNRYKAVQRMKSTMGPFPWNADKVDSLNLDDFDAVQNKDGTLSFPKLEARMKGRSIRARQKDFEYTEPSKWYDPFQTPDNTMLMNLLSKRG